MEKQLLRAVEPLTVEILERNHSKIVVKLPEEVKLEDGSTVKLSDVDNVDVDVSSKTNEQHNLRRDVRSVLRSVGILITCNQQYEMIKVLNWKILARTILVRVFLLDFSLDNYLSNYK